MYYKITSPAYANNYRILQTLRFKGNGINFNNHVDEIIAGINYFNDAVKKEAHKNPKEIYAVDIFEDCIAIFLSTDKLQSEPAKGLQLFTSYFTKNNTEIGKNEHNNKLFVKVAEPMMLSQIQSEFDIIRIIADCALNPKYAKKYSFEGLKRDELNMQLEEILINNGYAVR